VIKCAGTVDDHRGFLQVRLSGPGPSIQRARIYVAAGTPIFGVKMTLAGEGAGKGDTGENKALASSSRPPLYVEEKLRDWVGLITPVAASLPATYCDEIIISHYTNFPRD
jgi:hypothetical protein